MEGKGGIRNGGKEGGVGQAAVRAKQSEAPTQQRVGTKASTPLDEHANQNTQASLQRHSARDVRWWWGIFGVCGCWLGRVRR